MRLATVPPGGSRTRNSAVVPVTVAPLLTVILLTPLSTRKASPRTVLTFPPLTRIEFGVLTVPPAATIPWISAVRFDPVSVRFAPFSTRAPLPSELTTLLLETEILLPDPEANSPLARRPLALIVEFESIIVPGPEEPVEAAAPSAVFSRSPSPPVVVTLMPFPLMFPPFVANKPYDPLPEVLIAVPDLRVTVPLVCATAP